MAVPIGNAFADARLNEATLTLALSEHTQQAVPRLERFWAYYRNPQTPIGAARAGAGNARYAQAQEAGLPPRIAGNVSQLADDRSLARRERVIENDIAWRINAMVDFLLGKPVMILSLARDAALREALSRFLDRLFEQSGGIGLLQDMALLGHVYGHVDLLLRCDTAALRALGRVTQTRLAASGGTDARATILSEALDASARLMRVEVIEPRRGVAIVDPRDYRAISAYVVRSQTTDRGPAAPAPESSLARLKRTLGLAGPHEAQRNATTITEVISAHAWHVYENDVLVQATTPPTQGQIPVVHIQNGAQPFVYEGQGEVEPLIPLQNELNTRLSDRAARVTMQSFRMYLAKGIDGFASAPVGPGQVWITDNPEAQITEFGGDRDCPGEESHIREIRDALDKASGVPPIAAGVVQARIGNLSSANALRITLMGVLAKTARKRIAYGRGITQICALALTALDQSGVIGVEAQDRAVRLTWPDPLPDDLREQAYAASVKRDLGVPEERLLAELGYQPTDPGVTG